MEKELNISGKPVQFKCTGAFLLKYKALTGEDPIKAIAKMEQLEKKSENKKININDLDLPQLNTFYNIVWVLAKTADDSIPAMLEWIDGFDEFPIADILTNLLDLLQKAFTSNLSLKDNLKKKKQIKK